MLAGLVPALATSLSRPSVSLGCFFFLTALHIYANYRAVRALVMETLNEGRLRLVVKHFLQRGEVLDPTSANQMEPLWTGAQHLTLESCVSPTSPPAWVPDSSFLQVSHHLHLSPWGSPYTV